MIRTAVFYITNQSASHAKHEQYLRFLRSDDGLFLRGNNGSRDSVVPATYVHDPTRIRTEIGCRAAFGAAADPHVLRPVWRSVRHRQFGQH